MIEKLSELGGFAEMALLIFISGFLVRDRLAKLLDKLGIRSNNKKPECWPEVERRNALALDAEAMTQMRNRQEHLTRLIKEMHPIVVDEDGSLSTLLRLHEAYLPREVSVLEQLTGNKEPAWHNYTVIEQQKLLLKAVLDLTTFIEKLTAQVAEQTQAVLVAIDVMQIQMKGTHGSQG